MNRNTLTYRIASPFLLNAQGGFSRDAVVEFDDQWRVVSVETGVKHLDSLAATKYYNGILIPGMVNAHCHLELSFYQGAIPQHTGLVDFIKYVVKHRGDYTIREQVDAARRYNELMWREGIQAVGDISNGESSFAAKCEGRVKYHTFAEYFGMVSDEQSLNFFLEQTANVEAASELGLTITPTPHSTYLVSDQLFKLGADSGRLSIHFMETPSEVDYFQRRGGMYDFVVESGWQPDFIGYGSHPGRIIGSLPPDVPLLLIHNTMIRDRDVEQIMSYFRDVTFVLCPRSNYYIEATYPPAQMLRSMGARIALGTDSLSSNTSLSMVEEVKWLSHHNPEIPLNEILTWATAGGAQAIGMGGEIGSFEVGKQCGAVLLTDVDFGKMRLTEESYAQRVI